jgi:predicted HTH domain antitoxin
MASNQNKGGGARKYGRNKRKAAARSGAISKFVRGLISFETYVKLAKVKPPTVKKG